jgi:hypothetical protein
MSHDHQRTWSAPGLFYKRYQPSVHMSADLVNMNSSHVYLLTRKLAKRTGFRIENHTDLLDITSKLEVMCYSRCCHGICDIVPIWLKYHQREENQTNNQSFHSKIPINLLTFTIGYKMKTPTKFCHIVLKTIRNSKVKPYDFFHWNRNCLLWDSN